MSEIVQTTATAPPGPAVAPDFGSIAKSKLEGVRGWLLLFVIGQSLRSLLALSMIRDAFSAYFDGTMSLGLQFPIFLILIPIETLAHLAQIVMPIIGFVLMRRRSVHTKPFWILFLVSLAAYALIDNISGKIGLSQLVDVYGAEAMSESSAAMDEAFRENLQLMFYSVIWSAYWYRSKRVAATYPTE
jgi:hypothetical protein